MKVVALPLIASLATGAAGYWVAGAAEAPKAPAKSVARSVQTARQLRAAVEPVAILAAHAEPARATTRPAASTQPTDATQPSDPWTPPVVKSEGPLEGYEIVSVEDDIRFVPTTRPSTPQPQRPPLSTPENVDTGKPPREWQRLTDDWFGLRPRLDDAGLSIQASVTMDYSKVLHGGTDTSGGAFRHLFNLTATADTERLLGIHGGTLFVNFQNQNGDDGSEDVGALQGVSNIDADGRTQVSELWYEQLLLNDKLRLKVGRVDANAEFDHAPTADEFVNPSFGVSPTIVGIPTYPDPSMSVNVFWTPTDHLFVGAGVYDGSGQTGRTTGDDVRTEFFGGGSNLFYVGEAGVKWSLAGGRDGTLTVGAWHHTGTFDRFDGRTDNGATGQYAMLDQKLWCENPIGEDADDQGLSLFAKYGHADEDVSEVKHHVAVGLAWTGLFPDRDDDVLGLGVSWADLSEEAGFEHGAETAYELFYRVRMNAWFSVKPDIQYIHNAAAGGARDTVAGTVRVVIDF